jgi:hypothetical protein
MKNIITSAILIISGTTSFFCQDIGMSATQVEKAFPRTYWEGENKGTKNGVVYLKEESSHDTVFICNYSNNVLHGPFTYYHTFYVLKGQFINNQREGKWQLNEQGRFIESLNYTNDKAHGTYTKYNINYPKKVLLVEGKYVQGVKQGKWVAYYVNYKDVGKKGFVTTSVTDDGTRTTSYHSFKKKPSTKLKAVAIYENGKVIEYKEWDEQGNEVKYEGNLKDPFQNHINSSRY